MRTMNWIRMVVPVAAFATGMVLALPAQAHYLWLEQSGQTTRLFFGEYEEGLHERSPGRLDEMPGPTMRAVGKDGSLTDVSAVRQADSFTAAVPAAAAGVVVEESGYAVQDWKRYGIGVVKPMFYARLINGTQPVTPVLPLDIVPSGKPGQFKVTLRGEPLAGAEVRVVAPNTWAREEHSGKDGTVRFDLPWRGRYILHVVHKEATGGEFGGKPFEAIRHRATATFVVSSGPATTTPTVWKASPAQPKS